MIANKTHSFLFDILHILITVRKNAVFYMNNSHYCDVHGDTMKCESSGQENCNLCYFDVL